MDVTVKSSKDRMELLFMGYLSLLRTTGLKWVLETNPKTAVAHLLSAVKPPQLRQLLESDIRFSHAHVRKDFKEFIKHAVGKADSFGAVDIGPPKGRKGDKKDKYRSGGGSGSGKDSTMANENKKNHEYERKKNSGGGRAFRPIPFCPFSACSDKKLRHWIDDCESSTDDQKKSMRAEIAALKAKDGPSRSTRGQKAGSGESFTGTSAPSGIRRLRDPFGKSLPLRTMTVSDEGTSIEVIGRCDDGSDESIASPKLAERSVVKGTGKIIAIRTVSVKVALIRDSDAPMYTFSRSWTEPRTVLSLSSGQLALRNITFLVADDEMMCENLLIGLPVLRHLRVESKTLLEENITVLNDTNCQLDPSENELGQVGCLTVARLNRLQDVVP